VHGAGGLGLDQWERTEELSLAPKRWKGTAAHPGQSVTRAHVVSVVSALSVRIVTIDMPSGPAVKPYS
jgi:hypothetical protein